MALADIDHIIHVMLENRSFDQMLGYLSLDDTAGKMPVDGLRSDASWQSKFTNLTNDASFPLRKMSPSQLIRQDPPHGQASIAEQINSPALGPDTPQMGGFVRSYLKAHKSVSDASVVMGYFDGKGVPAYDFLARNYCVCDQWFSAVPLGTQANRLMAMAGESRVLDNVTGLPSQDLAYDWLEQRGVPWRVYVSGGYAPFFMMMGRWSLRIMRSLALSDGPFRRFSKFRKDWQSDRPMPSVIFIEPEYADAPMSDPNDDHPPAPISKGQDLIREIYSIATSNPDRWRRTLILITYDEHGGFFDHVPPPKIETTINGVKLETLGPRVPALLVSPHVAAGSVFSERLDHTSFLQLLAERFGNGDPYSTAVADRQASFGRITNALLAEPRDGAVPTMPPKPPGLAVRTAPAAPTAPNTPNAFAIDTILRDLAAEHPELINEPGWSETKIYLETNLPPTPEHRDNVGDVDEL